MEKFSKKILFSIKVKTILLIGKFLLKKIANNIIKTENKILFIGFR